MSIDQRRILSPAVFPIPPKEGLSPSWMKFVGDLMDYIRRLQGEIARGFELTSTGGLFPVLVVADGGDGSTGAPFTYTVKDIVTEVVIGTGMTPEHQRSPVVSKVAGTTTGAAYYLKSTLHLLTAQEVNDFEVCT